MDETCFKFLAGMGIAVTGLAGAVVALFRILQRTQMARLQEAKENRDTMRSLYEMVARRKR